MCSFYGLVFFIRVKDKFPYKDNKVYIVNNIEGFFVVVVVVVMYLSLNPFIFQHLTFCRSLVTPSDLHLICREDSTHIMFDQLMPNVSVITLTCLLCKQFATTMTQ